MVCKLLIAVFSVLYLYNQPRDVTETAVITFTYGFLYHGLNVYYTVFSCLPFFTGPTTRSRLFKIYLINLKKKVVDFEPTEPVVIK